MSFEHTSALESQPTNWRREDDPQYSDDPEFRRFTTELSDKLFSMTSNVTQLSNQVALLGTKRETERVRERVRDLIDETAEGFKDIGEGLKRVSAWHDLGVCFRRDSPATDVRALGADDHCSLRKSSPKESSTASSKRLSQSFKSYNEPPSRSNAPLPPPPEQL